MPRKVSKAHRRRAVAYAKSDMHHWHRRIIRAMIQKPEVMFNLAEGKYDKYFKKAE